MFWNVVEDNKRNVEVAKDLQEIWSKERANNEMGWKERERSFRSIFEEIILKEEIEIC